jgi:hypothetical protein
MRFDSSEVKAALTTKASIGLNRGAAARASSQSWKRRIASFALNSTVWVLVTAIRADNHGCF